MATREVVIANPVSTAIGTYGGTLKATPATELGAAVIRAVLERSGSRAAPSPTAIRSAHRGWC